MKKEFKPYPKYRNSGVESVGRIPEHWEVSSLRRVLTFSKGLSITKENLQDQGIPCVNYGEIHSKYGFGVDPNRDALKCVHEDFLQTNPAALLSTGDFVFADTSEDLEGSGNFTHVEGNAKVFAGYHTIIGRPSQRVDSLFLAYELHSTAFRTQVQRQVKGIKVFSITQAILKTLPCWLPPIKEQAAIANFLYSETTKIDLIIEQIGGLQNQSEFKEEKSLTELLKEYRNSLIYEAVTGKIDLRAA